MSESLSTPQYMVNSAKSTLLPSRRVLNGSDVADWALVAPRAENGTVSKISNQIIFSQCVVGFCGSCWKLFFDLGRVENNSNGGLCDAFLAWYAPESPTMTKISTGSCLSRRGLPALSLNRACICCGSRRRRRGQHFLQHFRSSRKINMCRFGSGRPSIFALE